MFDFIEDEFRKLEVEGIRKGENRIWGRRSKYLLSLSNGVNLAPVSRKNVLVAIKISRCRSHNPVTQKFRPGTLAG